MVMLEFWDSWISRAEDLAGKDSAPKELPVFYAKLLAAQRPFTTTYEVSKAGCRPGPSATTCHL